MNINVKYCEQCGVELSTNKRADSKFCSESCRKKYAVRKKQEQEKLMEQQKEKQQSLAVQVQANVQEPKLYEAEVVHHKNEVATEQLQKIPNYTESANLTGFEITQKIERLNTQFAELSSQKDSLMIDYNLRKERLEKVQNQSPLSIFEFVKTLQSFKDELAKHYRTQIQNRSYAKIEEDLANFFTKKPQIKALYEDKLNVSKFDKEKNCEQLSLAVLEKANEVKQVIRQIDQCRSEIQMAQQDLQELKKIAFNILSIKEKGKIIPQGNPQANPQANNSNGNSNSNSNSNSNGNANRNLQPVDTRNVVFERLNLGGHGVVLGDFFKGKAFIFLKGKSGQGKTTFSFALLKSMVNANLKCAYFLLETGYTPQIKALINRNGIYDKFELYGSGDIDDLKEVCKSGIEVVFIDSWQKLNADQKEVDILRNEYPKTIFVAISQETKDGSMRGGQGMYHDATCILEVQNKSEANKRVISVEKSRYGNQGKQYNYTL
jgi:outer membrane murein-binding lipoprotein Lpp